MAEKTKSRKENEQKKHLPSESVPKQDGEKIVVVPLSRISKKRPRNSRMKRSVKGIRVFLAKQSGKKPSDVLISQQLNEFLWKGGIHGAPSRIKVKVSESEGKVFARLMDEKEKPAAHKKKAGLRERLSRRREAAKEQKPEAASEKAEPKKEKPAPPEAAAKKPEAAKEKPKEEPKQDEMLLEENS